MTPQPTVYWRAGRFCALAASGPVAPVERRPAMPAYTPFVPDALFPPFVPPLSDAEFDAVAAAHGWRTAPCPHGADVRDVCELCTGLGDGAA